MSDFTGERLVPGEVDADLWNEHISRYSFALSLCKGGERVLDAGCGTGYGTSFLSQSCGAVLGIDCSAEAIRFATRQYRSSKARFAVALCENLPVPDGSADLIVAFEVIEHLEGWRKFLEECRRVLSAKGLLVVSTPNKQQYTQSRGDAGPNPFHIHEFEFEEFTEELHRVFLNVHVFGQNHAESIVFAAVGGGSAMARFGSGTTPAEAGFFVAVCGNANSPVPPDFVYVPEAANLLEERERHIRLLADELHSKKSELTQLHNDHAALVVNHRRQKAELERSNDWAASLDKELKATHAELTTKGARIFELQDELNGAQVLAQSEISRLQTELDARAAWARGLDAEITQCTEHLHSAENTIEERTNWALALQSEIDGLKSEVASIRASNWARLGRFLRTGPR